MNAKRITIVSLLAATSLHCYNWRPTPILRGDSNPQAQVKASRETGICSFTSMERQGTKMSSGEVYNTYDMVAAHRTLPFGTVVRVTNLNNNKFIDVVIRDRGPFIRGRIIDISYAAALKLDMVKDGLVPVTVEVIARR